MKFTKTLIKGKLIKRYKRFFTDIKINKKGDIIIFVESKKFEIIKRLKKRKNFNLRLFKRFKNIQLPLDYKKKKSHFIIKNDFTNSSIKDSIRIILKEIL